MTVTRSNSAADATSGEVSVALANSPAASQATTASYAASVSPSGTPMELLTTGSILHSDLVSPLPPSISDKVRRLEICVGITAEKVARYSELIASAPLGQDTSANEKLLEQASAMLELHRKNLVTLKETQQDTVESTGLKKFSSIVPRELRPFQWEGHLHFSDRGDLFTDLDECLQNFQDVVLCHRLDLNTNYVRLLPPLLSATVRSWFTEYLAAHKLSRQTEPSWVDFCSAIKLKFGRNILEVRLEAAKALGNISMLAGESIEAFLERLNTLRRKAGTEAPSNFFILERLAVVLPPLVSEHMRSHATFFSDNAADNFDYVLLKVKSLYNNMMTTPANEHTARRAAGTSAVSSAAAPSSSSYAAIVAPRTPKRQHQTIDSNDPLHQNSNQSKHILYY